MHKFILLSAAMLSCAAVMTACDKREPPQPKVEPDDVIEKAERKIEEMGAHARLELREAKARARAAADQASADVRQAGEEVSDKVADAAISTTVHAAFAKDASLSATKIDVDTTSGHVALRGAASSAAARDRATELAARVKGVRSVDNQLTVESAKM